MASSSSSSVRTRYQVFLSFRGEDTRHSFTSHLLKALKDRGIHVFFDENELKKGEDLTPALLKAIQASKISIIILSKDYASSKSCLAELSHIMECKLSKGQIVLPIFYRVNPSDVRHHGGPFEESFHQHLINKPEEVERWKAAFTRVGSLKGWHIDGGNFDRSETEYIEGIVKVVLEKLTSMSASVYEDLVGIDDHIKKLVQLINQEDTRFIGIWGMGGMGKTTLAEAVYSEVVYGSNKFGAHHFLSNVRERSEKNGMQSLRDDLLPQLLKEDRKIYTPRIRNQVIQDRLNNIRALVVLDDVTNSDQIDGLGVYHLGPGSKIIVTSRDRQLLKHIGVGHELHEVKELNGDDSLALFCHFAFKQYNPVADFRDLSMKILSYAGGQPLALKVLGRALYGRSRDVWESTLKELEEYPEYLILNPLKISYDGLGPLEQKIFLDVACFFTGEKKDYVTKLLEGFYGGGVLSGITKLVDKCLLDERSSGCLWMHDLLQEMGRDIVRQESEDPGRRSRLWSAKDVYDVLKDNKEFINLRRIVLKGCKKIRKIPNLLGARKLEELNCDGCLSLVEVPCMTHLISLRSLNLVDCPISKLPEIPTNIEELNLRETQIEEVPSSLIGSLKKLWRLNMSKTNITELNLNMWTPPDGFRILNVELCDSLKSLSGLPPWLEVITATNCTSLERVSFRDNVIEGYKHHPYKRIDVRDCRRLQSLLGLPPCMESIDARNCTSLESVSFSDHDDCQDYKLGEHSMNFDFEFGNCFKLNQDARDNSFAAFIRGKIQVKWAEHLKDKSDLYLEKAKPLYRVRYYLPGSEILDKFENKSRNSSITVKLVDSPTSRRFLCFTLCLVFDLFGELDYCPCRYFIHCKYQLKNTNGVHQNFRGEWHVDRPKAICMGRSNHHVFVMSQDRMVHKDMDYTEASFEFKVCRRIYCDARLSHKEKIKVEKCGVHVVYVDAVDAKCFTVSDAGSSTDFSCEEGNTSCSPIVHSVARLTIEEDANVGNGHGLKTLLLQ